MSKLRLNLKSSRGRWSLALAVLILAVSAGVVFAIAVGVVTSRFYSAVGGDCVAYDPASGYADLARVKWGEPQGFNNCPVNGMNDAKSGYDFDGVTVGDVPPSTNFLIGTFTHHNWPIDAGTSITQVSFTLQVPICEQTLTFTGYTFEHDETDNWPDCGSSCDCNASNYEDYDYCEYGPSSTGWPGGSRCPNWPGDTGPNSDGCGDRVTLPTQTPQQTFSCNGYEYTLALSAFDLDCNPATANSSRYFYTKEAADSSVCVYAQITAPSAISLASMSAAAQGDAIQVTWDTVSEINNAGFNLYRDTSAEGPGIKLNESLIPSQAPNSSTGFSYSFTDSAGLVPGTTYTYRLEDVSFSGTTAAHDPVSVIYGTAPNAVGLASFGAASSLPAALPFAGLILTALGAAAISRKRK